ncbi:MAG: hypothetical protein QXT45_03430 [Candidatus Bilamarchaeaceae archaeon]
MARSYPFPSFYWRTTNSPKLAYFILIKIARAIGSSIGWWLRFGVLFFRKVMYRVCVYMHYPYIGVFSARTFYERLGKMSKVAHYFLSMGTLHGFLAYTFPALKVFVREATAVGIPTCIVVRDIYGVQMWYAIANGTHVLFYLLDTCGSGNGYFRIPVVFGRMHFVYLDTLRDYFILDLTKIDKECDAVYLQVSVNNDMISIDERRSFTATGEWQLDKNQKLFSLYAASVH